MGSLSRIVGAIFYKLGELIATSPKYFIIAPIILTAICSFGFLRLNYVNDAIYLYTQSDGKTHFEEEQVNRLFPTRYNGRFHPSRLSQVGRFARVIITTKNEEPNSSVLTTEAWNEILTLDSLLHNITITWNNEEFNYTSLCANWFGTCFENEFLDLTDEIVHIENGSSKMKYPIAFNPKTLNGHVLPLYFGDLQLTDDEVYVKGTKAVLLHYIIAVDSPEENERGRVWESAVLEVLKEYESNWNATKVRVMVLEALATEVDNGLFAVIPHFTITLFLMGAFATITSMMKDWVKSKPWLGIAGSISPLLGTLTGGGLLCFFGVPFVGVNLAIPFLMLGIGIDDSFVMISSWRRTSSKDPVPKRLAECYSDAAVSVTITTLTDMMSLYIGALTTIPIVQIFSYYAGTCILFIYIYQLCFFGGFMAISGYHEAENKHAVFWWMDAIPKSKAEGVPKWKQLLFTGGYDKDNALPENYKTENIVMTFFRKPFPNFLFHPGVKIIVMLTFVLYIGVSVWGITKMDVGLRLERTVRYDSFVNDFIAATRKYFRGLAHRIQVVVDTPLDYSKNETQNQISDLLQGFYKMDQITDQWSENWLEDFNRFVEKYGDFYNFTVSTEQDFISALRENFLSEKIPISSDILFNENKTKILATRYIIQSQNIVDVRLETDLVVKLREVCAKAKENGLNVSIYFPWFHITDQVIVIGDITKKLVAVASAIVMCITMLLIPNVVCSLSVLFSIVSIEIGVLGFMSLWGVSLDLISVLCVIMCIGFSVDFSAHISYAFITSEADNTEDKMRDAMYCLGVPVVQGAISTVIGIGALLFAQSYIYEVFFKVGVLVIVLAVCHSLFLLPVLFLIVKPDQGYMSKRKSFSVQTIKEMRDSKDNHATDKFSIFSSHHL